MSKKSIMKKFDPFDNVSFAILVDEVIEKYFKENNDMKKFY